MRTISTDTVYRVHASAILRIKGINENGKRLRTVRAKRTKFRPPAWLLHLPARSKRAPMLLASVPPYVSVGSDPTRSPMVAPVIYCRTEYQDEGSIQDPTRAKQSQSVSWVESGCGQR